MSKKCKEIDFPHCDQFESITVCIGYYHLNHILDDHITKKTELWARRTGMKESLFKRFISSSSSKPNNYLLYSNLVKVLFSTIQWSSHFPLYIKLTESVSKSAESSKSKNSNICVFLAREGYIIIAGAKRSKLNINTAYFPNEVNKHDTDYQVFVRTFIHLKRRYYKNKLIYDRKYDQNRRITDCSFINNESWQQVPTIEEFFGI